MGNKILVIGCDSCIATSLIDVLTEKGNQVEYTSRRTDNLGSLFLDLKNVDFFLESDPPTAEVVVISAAITKFEICRNDPKTAYQINVSAPVKIAEHYLKMGARVVFLSTSAVFDGNTPFVHPTKLPNSKTEYGKLKADAEKQLTSLSKDVAILRFSKIIVPGDNIFSLWLSALGNGEVVTAFDDQFISPLSLEIAINALVTVINDDQGGIYQFSANGDISYFDVLKYCVHQLNIEPSLINKEKASEKGLPDIEIFRYNSLESSRLENLMNCAQPDYYDFLHSL